MRISILTPTVNGREWFLNRAKYSVRWQTWLGPLEHIVVDGTGTPPAEAFQQALERAKGELVMPLADDDWLAPHTVETLVAFFDLGRDWVDWVTAQTVIMRSHGDTMLLHDGDSIIVGGKPDPKRLANGFYLGGAHMWRKTLTDKHGGFDPTFSHCADYELYWRLSKVAKTYFHPEPLYFYTDHENTDGNLNGALINEQCAAIRALHT